MSSSLQKLAHVLCDFFLFSSPHYCLAARVHTAAAADTGLDYYIAVELWDLEEPFVVSDVYDCIVL